MTNPATRIGIIGGGFTGTMLAVQLMRHHEFRGEILLFDGRGTFGRGLAYSTRNPDHLLNVRVANMSAFEDDPADFTRWLWRVEGRDGRESSIPPSGHAFVSRAAYGTYIQDVFHSAREEAHEHVAVRTISADVADLTATPGGAILRTIDGEVFEVDRAVLCIGNFEPSSPFEICRSEGGPARYIADPWDEAARDRIGPGDSITIVGTGLTMIDVVIDLLARGHDGPIRAISRRGLTPHSHALARTYPAFLDRGDLPSSALVLLAKVRREVSIAAQDGFGWRSVIDSMRPLVQDLWRALPQKEQRRFLRHLRPYWDVHRHRTAEKIAEQIDALRNTGRLTVAAGRVLDAAFGDEGVDLKLRLRGSSATVSAHSDWLINCAGPECDYTRIRHPLVRCLLSSGTARPDRLNLGLDVSATLGLVDRDGEASETLFALGPPTRGGLWEITAVPDIRKHCARLAVHLVESLVQVPAWRRINSI